MATNSFSGYGTFNPNAVDPFPIETTLAHDAYGQYPAEAQTQLDYYQLERQRNANLYGQELEAQHEQFRQNLAQQMYEHNIKGLTELAKAPGGLQLARASPYYQGILGGADDPTVLSVIAQQLEAQNATNLEHGGAGLLSAVNAGVAVPNTANVPGVRQMGNLPIGDPVAVRDALINANARIAAANIRASADKDNLVVPVNMGKDPVTGEMNKAGLKIRLNATPEEAQARLDRARMLLGQTQAGHPGVAGAPTPQDGGGQPAARPTQSNLPQAPVDRGSTATSKGVVTLTDTPSGKVDDPRTEQGIALQGRARQGLRRLPEGARTDIGNISRKMDGIIPIVVRKGKAYYLNSAGQPVAEVP